MRRLVQVSPAPDTAAQQKYKEEIRKEAQRIAKGRSLEELDKDIQKAKDQIVLTQKDHQKVIDKAKDEANSIIQEAGDKAELIIRDATAQRAKIEQEAAQVLAGAKNQEALIREKLDETKRNLHETQVLNARLHQLEEEWIKKKKEQDKLQHKIEVSQSSIAQESMELSKQSQELRKKEKEIDQTLAGLRIRESEIAAKEDEAQQFLEAGKSAMVVANQKHLEMQTEESRLQAGLLELRHLEEKLDGDMKQFDLRDQAIKVKERQLAEREKHCELREAQIRAARV